LIAAASLLVGQMVLARLLVERTGSSSVPSGAVALHRLLRVVVGRFRLGWRRGR